MLTQDLWIDSKRIATYDQRKNLNGKFRKVKHTPFDFTEPRQIGTRIHRDDEQLNITDGYDHSFILRHPGNQRKPAAVLYDAQSGRTLTVYTTEPAIHVYTANGLKGKMVGKGGKEKGAVWVAMRIPDDCIAGHANQSRIYRFPLYGVTTGTDIPLEDSVQIQYGYKGADEGEVGYR